MLTRRDVLYLVAASIPGLAAGCGSGDPDPDAIPESITRFPRTPIAGDMTSTRVVLAFFVADDTAVTLRLWTDDEMVVDQRVEPSGDGFHKVRIDDLTPGTTYRYAVFSGEAPDFESRSLIGQVRTAPAADDEPVVRIALLCCVGSGTLIPDYYYPEHMEAPTQEPFQWELFTHASEHDLDFLVHLGDQAYLDFVWSQQDGELDAYLHAWGFYHGGGYRDVYPLAGVYTTWDDHESTDNGKFNPWDMSADEQRKLGNAMEAWFKVVPIDSDVVVPIWRQFRWGGTVELILLDARYELTDERLMSAEQLQFLLDAVRASPCRFICVATPRPFAEIPSPEIFEDNQDRWDAYPAERDQVRALLDELEARHVIFVTGDIHVNYLGRTSLDGTAVSETAWEVCCTSGNVSPLASSLKEPQFAHVAGAPQLPVLTFDPAAGEVHVAFYAQDGSLAFERTLDDV